MWVGPEEAKFVWKGFLAWIVKWPEKSRHDQPGSSQEFCFDR